MTEHDYTSYRQPYTLDKVVRLLITIVCLGIGLWLLYRLRDALIPFFVACIIAYIIEPFVQFNKRVMRLRGRMLPIVITLFELALLFCVLAYFFVPSIIEEFHGIGGMILNYAQSSQVNIPFLPDHLHDSLRDNIDLERIASWLFDQNLEHLMSQGVKFISSGMGVILSIISWFIVFLYVAFILLDYDKLMAGFKDLVPPKYRVPVFKVARDVKISMNLYFRGQATIALIVAVLYSIGFLLVGLPLAVVMGLIIGVLFMVPYLVYISIIPVTGLCIVMAANGGVDFWTIWWECIAVYAVIQLIADVYLTPKIMGKAMGLNPAIILLSLSIWGSLLGFMGLIIALPLTTLILSYYDVYIIRPAARRLDKKGKNVTDRNNKIQTDKP